MKNLTWQNPEQLFVAQELINKVKSKCCGIKDIHKICGSKSGRDIDKVAATGLKPFATPEGNIAYEQARMVLECRKLYADMIKPEQFIDASLVSRWYGEGHGGFHKMYVVEIEHVWVKE